MAQRASGPVMAHSTSSIYPPAATAPGAETEVRPAWLEVDLGIIRRNAERLQAAAGLPMIAMVKADGYGCGAIAVARALVPMRDRLWGFGVASLAEAAALRDAGIGERLFCPTPLLPSELRHAHRLLVRPALHRAADIGAWAATGAPWHLSIDTGMSRAGIRWDDVSSLVPVLARHAPEGVFTHFHSAEMRNGSQELQEARFAQAIDALRAAGVLDDRVLVHRDNSAGIASRARSNAASPGGLARTGIGLYGAVVAAEMGLEQPVQLRARIIDLREVHAGETVSYCGEWQATRTHHVATVALGHGDGYRRALSGKGVGLLHGTDVPVLGIVTMDMTMLDVTGLACAIGDVVTFIGRDGDRCLSTDDVAARRPVTVRAPGGPRASAAAPVPRHNDGGAPWESVNGHITGVMTVTVMHLATGPLNDGQSSSCSMAWDAAKHQTPPRTATPAVTRSGTWRAPSAACICRIWSAWDSATSPTSRGSRPGRMPPAPGVTCCPCRRARTRPRVTGRSRDCISRRRSPHIRTDSRAR